MSLAYWCKRSPSMPRFLLTVPQDSTGHTRNINGQHRAALANTQPKPKEKKTHDALFGPNIGVVSSGPAWTVASEKRVLSDELTPDIVTNWVAKSKDTSQPTTTLQALVNLKRPTLRLSPLTSEDATAEHHHHGLEFEYDCDAPKCGIYVHVLLPKDHPDAPSTATTSGAVKFLVFESVVDGGFGKLLKLEDGALLELGRFEYIPTAPTSTPLGETSSSGQGDTSTPNLSANRNARRRFTHLPFRKRTQNHSVSGPALRVLDPDPSPVNEEKTKDDSMEGVRVIIRLAALDAQGTELASPNEQVTYLHVLRLGTRAEDDNDDDSRPWVVKVAKREATIGPHTFHLHEIYGLTSPSTAPQAPAHTPEHTYPPPVTPSNSKSPVPPPAVTEDEPQSECLLCLSSPREVVLLPCRHLVACKECALNMVEFGAGGNITQPTEGDSADVAPAAGPAPSAEGGEAGPGPNTSAAPAPAAGPVPAGTNPNQRRKRKAKGWFCPVCRQPYASLLRITTQPPPPQAQLESEPAVAQEPPAASAAANNAPAVAPENARSGGLLPGFLRNLSFTRNPAGDIENQAGMARVGA
ncbi:hypothetical protein H0H92_006652 [Tricholoma furcatifolium]|nr:hypothetical protein H0H92_006652 [Tricholoma furcatifolium]